MPFSCDPQAFFSVLKIWFPVDTNMVMVMHNPLLNTAPHVISPAHISWAASEIPGSRKVCHLTGNGMPPTSQIFIPDSPLSHINFLLVWNYAGLAPQPLPYRLNAAVWWPEACATPAANTQRNGWLGTCLHQPAAGFWQNTKREFFSENTETAVSAFLAGATSPEWQPSSLSRMPKLILTCCCASRCTP